MKDLLMFRWNNFLKYIKNNQIQCEYNLSEQPTKVVRITPETLYAAIETVKAFIMPYPL